jgi:hypothetical protein
MSTSLKRPPTNVSNIKLLEDGTWQVDVGGVCASFVVLDGEVIKCAPILRRSFPFWVALAKRVPDNKPLRTGDTVPKTMETETEQPQSTTLDISFDVTEADVARPVLQAGTYDAIIGFAREEASRKQGKPTLMVGYRLAQVAKDTHGRDVNPGFTVIQRILTKPTGNLTPTMIEDRLKQIHFAACGEGRFDGNTAHWLGRKVRIRVSLREPRTDKETGTEYGESNEIARVMPSK